VNMVYSCAECVFILKHNIASKLFVAVHEAFSNEDADKEVQNKTIIHHVVTKYQDIECACVFS
jgi:Zn-finger protein